MNDYCREIENWLILRSGKEVKSSKKKEDFCENSSFSHRIQSFHATLPYLSSLVKVKTKTVTKMKFEITVIWFQSGRK